MIGGVLVFVWCVVILLFGVVILVVDGEVVV